MRVLSWNLFHGRSLPPRSRSLLAEFTAKLAAWSWEIALLQEVPPWWPAHLASELGVEQRSALTSRNSLLPLRKALAERSPELLKSNGGGCNALLSRTPIAEHSTLRLRCLPERRVAQLARLQDGTCVVNVHASTRPARAGQELERLWHHVLDWSAASDRLILGGDLNMRRPPSPPASPPPRRVGAGDAGARAASIAHVAGSEVDHLFAMGLLPAEDPQRIDRHASVDGRSVELSDHAPLLVRLRAEPGSRTAASR